MSRARSARGELGALGGAALLAAVLVLTPAGSAHAWQPIASSRPVWCMNVPYSMNSAGSADLGPDTSEMIVQQAMGDWTMVPCTSLRSTYMGRTSAVPGNSDGTSVIGWHESSWGYDSVAIGVTGPRWSTCIVEADMELNGRDYTWVTGPGSGGSVNAYTIVLHEGGHYYGMGHSSDPSAVMYASYSGGIKHLTTDDENGICTLYPGSGSLPDCTTTGCPSGETCVSGTCQTMTGDGTLCSRCTDSSQCGGAGDYCLMYPDGASYCGRACTSSADCSGGVCATGGAGGQCVMIDSTGNPSCAGGSTTGCHSDSDCSSTQRCDTSTGSCVARPSGGASLGQPCSANSDCNSGNCLTTPGGAVCTSSCNWVDPSSCPSGFYCSSTASGSCGSGLCLAGTAGSGAIGDACSTDTDCAGLLCSDGVCSAPCIPGGAAACPVGYTCQVGPVTGCGTCKVTGALGDACTVVDDCASRDCACRSGDCWCTTLCDDAHPCPSGFACESAGGNTSVCAPTGGTTGDGGVTRRRRSPRGGCGCRAAGAGGAHDGRPRALLLLALLGLVWTRRRRF